MSVADPENSERGGRDTCWLHRYYFRSVARDLEGIPMGRKVRALKALQTSESTKILPQNIIFKFRIQGPFPLFSTRHFQLILLTSVYGIIKDKGKTNTKTLIECKKVFSASWFNYRNSFRKWKKEKNRFQLYARAYVCIWKLPVHSCIYFNENSSQNNTKFHRKRDDRWPLGRPLNLLMNAVH